LCRLWHLIDANRIDLQSLHSGPADGKKNHSSLVGDGNGDCDGDGDDWQAKPKWSKVGDSPIRTPSELWSATALCTDYGQTAFCWLLWVVLLQD